MHIFLDESGDLGSDFNGKKPSTHFVVTLLVCHDRNTLFSFKVAAKKTLLRLFNSKKTNRKTTELKGSNATVATKEYFFKQLSKHPSQNWGIYSIILDKVDLLSKTQTPLKQHRIYNLLSAEILKKVNLASAIT